MARKVSFTREQEIRAAKSADKARTKGKEAGTKNQQWKAQRQQRLELANTFTAGMKVVTEFGDEGVVIGPGANGDVHVKIGTKTTSVNAEILKPASDTPRAE